MGMFDVWMEQCTKDLSDSIDRRIMERLMRKLYWRDPKKWQSQRKHYLNKKLKHI
jgi:hypothetical protein